MWWRFKDLDGRTPHDFLAEALVRDLPKPPIPVVSVARGLKIEVVPSIDLEIPKTCSSVGNHSARIELPERYRHEVAESRHLIARGIGQVLFSEAGVNELRRDVFREFADALLVPQRLLASYGRAARWNPERLALAFGVTHDVVERRLHKHSIA